MSYVLVSMNVDDPSQDRIITFGPDASHLVDLARKDLRENCLTEWSNPNFKYFVVPISGPLKISDIDPTHEVTVRAYTAIIIPCESGPKTTDHLTVKPSLEYIELRQVNTHMEEETATCVILKNKKSVQSLIDALEESLKTLN